MAFGFPVSFSPPDGSGFGWSGVRPQGVDKNWGTACLLLPIVSLGMVVKVDFDIILAVRLESPILTSFVYVILAGVVPDILIYFILRLWRPGHDDSSR
jgi:hypothetical protein